MKVRFGEPPLCLRPIFSGVGSPLNTTTSNKPSTIWRCLWVFQDVQTTEKGSTGTTCWVSLVVCYVGEGSDMDTPSTTKSNLYSGCKVHSLLGCLAGVFISILAILSSALLRVCCFQKAQEQFQVSLPMNQPGVLTLRAAKLQASLHQWFLPPAFASCPVFTAGTDPAQTPPRHPKRDKRRPFRSQLPSQRFSSTRRWGVDWGVLIGGC